uniref:GIY-YIG domain-containing protein n=1 Tax=Strongyloides venezuelensis TaxID=75913 RepID=A0A0K0G260_STRVS
MDLNEIRMLYYENLLNGELLFVDYNSSLDEVFPRCDFYTRLPNGRFCFDYLSIRIEGSRKFGILYDGNLHRNESLKKLGLFERNETRLFRRKIAIDLIYGNSISEYVSAPTYARKSVDIQITNRLYKLGLLNPGNTCS